MRSVQIQHYGPANELALENVATPTISAGQILVAVKAAGVNPVDTYIRSGTNNYTANFPHTPGLDGAGIITQVGQDIDGFQVGQRVYFSRNLTGSAAEFAVCMPTHTFPLADALSYEEGACLGIPYTTAHRALLGRANAKTGENVLVHGATGAVGIATIQLAQAMGMNVVASAGTDEGKALLIKQGVSTVLDHTQPDHLSPYQSLDQGFDVIIEMLANHNLDQDIKALALGGRVAVVGNRGTVEINPRDLMARDAAVMGVALANIKPSELNLIARSLYPLLNSGLLKPVIRQVYPLTDLAKAHEDVLKSGAQGNLVVKIE
ncbi:NADPH:quinone reductase [Marinomonas sp. 2405UD68-3]|uniref:NADPH:quinone reductase n=1 Tax=Marinomonas sp. 2405UD68-3 TaxID=3391835 RepID=UPI0039C9DD09